VAKKTKTARIETRRVAVLAFDGVVLGDLSVPCEVFTRARNADGSPAYDVRVCSAQPRVRTRHLQLDVPHRLRQLGRAHTVVVPGLDEGAPLPTKAVAALKRALSSTRARRPRAMSICTGAFVLAATGVLDGLRVTTHWRACALLKQRFPALEVDPDVLYVDHGELLTSAGAAAAVDLCLHVVREDLGAVEAARVARLAVAPLERSGGQAQFIEHPPPETGDTPLADLGLWLECNVSEDLSLPALAKRAGLSTRTLTRHVKRHLGITPAQWVAQTRVRRAQALLERTELSIEQIAEQVGFGSTAVLREHFARSVKVSPSQWRRSFAGRGPGG
jgi:transcriptional regulator GlxA family with amidase domain